MNMIGSLAMKKPSTFEAIRRQREMLSPEAFLELSRHSPQAIKSSRIVPPRLGGPGFGKIEVEYAHPRYVIKAA